MSNDICALSFEELDEASGGASLGEAILIGAATGGFIGSLASPAGSAVGALVGGVVGAVLYELP